ncbi:POU domain, class 6, transcription factor 2-like [Frankliniella occidentalis]|uniref:POU domain, class 6, transcription factor 2-like n=1 Tax=Frankliniella occidentalis TaxID=133901 RepID=A0A9C6XTL5_FRAOC|nr:POU domain, class 6, transcription factor 2-like [Frankliniella occidentalis]
MCRSCVAVSSASSSLAASAPHLPNGGHHHHHHHHGHHQPQPPSTQQQQQQQQHQAQQQQQQQQPQQQPQPQPHPSMLSAARIREQRERDREQRERRERERERERELERDREREVLTGHAPPIHPAHRPSPMMAHHSYQVPEKGHGTSNGLLNGIASSISRLAANNCDLTITTTNTPSGSASPPQAHSFHNNNNNISTSNNNNNNNSSNVNNNNRHSPLQLQIKSSNTGGGGGSQHSGSSTGALSPVSDLLDDNPNQPTINQANTNMVDGINLDEIKEFAKAFKIRRLSLGLTQTQVGQALSITEGPAYSQSAICSALATQMICAAQIANQRPNVFEKLDITPKSAQKIKPVLEHWMKEAEERYKIGQNHLTEFIGMEPSKKRKRRTSFTPQALELLNHHFERNTHPSGTEITALAHQLGYDREVIRIWFCNKRQALKNTVRMMSKDSNWTKDEELNGARKA